MQDGTFNFKTNDGLTMLGRVWQTTGTPKGIVNLVHGLGEHTGRYAHIAEALTKIGYNLIGFDLRGHGLSEGKRGHTPDYDYIMMMSNSSWRNLASSLAAINPISSMGTAWAAP